MLSVEGFARELIERCGPNIESDAIFRYARRIVSQEKGTKTRVVVYFDTRGIQVVGENEDSAESILNIFRDENDQPTHHWEKRKLPMTDEEKRCQELVTMLNKRKQCLM